MKADEKAKEDIAKQHASPHWRDGPTKKAANSKAGKDINGLSKAKRAEIEEIKYNKDHKIDADPFDAGE